MKIGFYNGNGEWFDSRILFQFFTFEIRLHRENVYFFILHFLGLHILEIKFFPGKIKTFELTILNLTIWINNKSK